MELEAKTKNAGYQAAYRLRRKETHERLNLVVTAGGKYRLNRLARHYGVSLQDTLDRLTAESETALLNGLSAAEQAVYLREAD